MVSASAGDGRHGTAWQAERVLLPTPCLALPCLGRFATVRPYFLSLIPSTQPQWQYAPVNLLTPIPLPTPPDSTSSSLSVGAIAGIVIASVVVVSSIVSAVVFFWYRRKLKKRVERGEVNADEVEAEERGWK